ncbi:MAG: thiamine ABC transporter substrate binding subunit [Paracoccaceae bacterium]
MRSLKFAAGFLACATPALAETPVLNVLAYDSFVSEWGPGPAIEKAFEAECACDLVFTGAGDGAALLTRVRMEGEATETDVVLGLDTSLTAAAAGLGLFAPHGITGTYDMPKGYDDPLFVPYDYGWFGFVYDKTKLSNPPKSFRELADSNLKIILQDPRSSTPGLGLVMWVRAAFEEDAGEMWKDLADNVLTVTPGWSEAYGLFLEGEADMVLSYTTSPAYHRIAEQDDTKAVALFDEGHYLQVEVAGMLASSDQPDLAKRFLAFLVSDAAQSVLPTTNWMFPARTPAAGLPEGFEDDARPGSTLTLPPERAMGLQEGAIAEWQDALSR